MKIVLDTNIFVSGIFWIGNCNKIINSWKEKKFELIISYETLSELKKVLSDFKIQLPEEMIKEWVELIIINSVLVEISEKLDIIKEDKQDNIFLETAISGQADYIISQDNHLLDLKEFRGVRIINPEQFLELQKSLDF